MSPKGRGAIAGPSTEGLSSCLICCSDVEPASILSDTGSDLTRKRLKNYYVLRHILDLPENLLQYYFTYCPGPETWISICQLCSEKFVSPCLTLVTELTGIQKKINAIKRDVVTSIKESDETCSMEEVPFVRNICLESRQFVCNRIVEDSSKERISLSEILSNNHIPDELLQDEDQQMDEPHKKQLMKIRITPVVKSEPEEAPENSRSEYSSGEDGEFEDSFEPEEESIRQIQNEKRNQHKSDSHSSFYKVVRGSAKPYQCKTCSYKTTTVKVIKGHLKKFHANTSKKECCSQCGTYFQPLRGYKTNECWDCQLNAPHKRVVYTCEQCDYKTDRPDSINRHRRRKDHKPGQFKLTDLGCRTCMNEYSNKHELKRHRCVKSRAKKRMIRRKRDDSD